MIGNPFKPILDLISRLESEEFLIDEERQELLFNAASSIVNHLSHNEKTELVIICTHNSRRSQLGEIWIRVAADYYDLPQIISYSGGTESTAFNPRAVRALAHHGFHISQKTNDENYKYEIHWKHNQTTAQVMFSKIIGDPFNPQANFIAILVCDHADEECPVVSGASERYFIGYEDPKYADGSLAEANVYNSKVSEIGREMLFLLRKVKELKEQ